MIAYLRWLWYTLTGKEAVRLNLRVRNPGYEWQLIGGDWVRFGPRRADIFRRYGMAKIGDKFTATIAPTNAAGKPAPVTDVFFEELSDLYDVESVSADGLSATFVAVKSGSGATVTVTAKSKSGATLTDAKALPDVDEPAPDEEATALNLTVA